MSFEKKKLIVLYRFLIIAFSCTLPVRRKLLPRLVAMVTISVHLNSNNYLLHVAEDNILGIYFEEM